MWGQRAKRLAEREGAVRAREEQVRQEFAKLDVQRQQLEKVRHEVMLLHDQVTRKTETKTDTNRGFVPGECEFCGYEGEFLVKLPVYNGETRRMRNRLLCSEECQHEMDSEQRDLAEGMNYVKQSLGLS
jgi:hypothetical protein